MKALFVLPVALGLALAGAPTARLEPASSVTYFASAGPNDRWSANAPMTATAFSFDPAKPLETRFTLQISPDDFDSGNGIRDANARGNVFETYLHPTVTLTALEVTGEAKPLRAGEGRDLTVRARLELHGTARELRIPVRVAWTGTALQATSAFAVSLDEFKVPRPKFLVLNVDDTVRLSVKLEATVK